MAAKKASPTWSDVKSKLADFDRSSWADKLTSAKSRQAWLDELQQMPNTKAAEIASLLGVSTSPPQGVVAATTAANSASPASAASATAGATPLSQSSTLMTSSGGELTAAGTATGAKAQAATPVLPMVFRQVDPTVMSLTPEQVQTINDLRQTFIDEVGGPNQDPSDPAYLQRWLKAQPDVDKLLQGMLGVMAWETYQVATWNPPAGG